MRTDAEYRTTHLCEDLLLFQISKLCQEAFEGLLDPLHAGDLNGVSVKRGAKSHAQIRRVQKVKGGAEKRESEDAQCERDCKGIFVSGENSIPPNGAAPGPHVHALASWTMRSALRSQVACARLRNTHRRATMSGTSIAAVVSRLSPIAVHTRRIPRFPTICEDAKEVGWQQWQDSNDTSIALSDYLGSRLGTVH